PTFIPTPWTFLRYVPVIGTARMPPRFDAVVTVGVCVLFASALAALRARMGRHGRLLFAVVAAAALFEWLPAPRTLYSADIPGIARTIAADPRPIRILELPFGIRDGLSSLGDFTAASQLYQTVHGKALVGGYLSRVDGDRKALYQQIPFTSVLLDVSEHKPVAAGRMEAARQTGRAFADA